MVAADFSGTEGDSELFTFTPSVEVEQLTKRRRRKNLKLQ